VSRNIFRVRRDPLARQPDGIVVGFAGGLLLAGDPPVRVRKVAPVGVGVRSELNRFVEQCRRFLVFALEKAERPQVPVTDRARGDLEGALKRGGRIGVVTEHVVRACHVAEHERVVGRKL
jgi:hypothetical protein